MKFNELISSITGDKNRIEDEMRSIYTESESEDFDVRVEQLAVDYWHVSNVLNVCKTFKRAVTVGSMNSVFKRYFINAIEPYMSPYNIASLNTMSGQDFNLWVNEE